MRRRVVRRTAVNPAWEQGQAMPFFPGKAEHTLVFQSPGWVPVSDRR